MSQAPSKPLNYAAPASIKRRFLWFQAVTLALALFCAMFNVSLIVVSVSNLRAAAEVYPNLTGNPKYYGRDISPAVIDSLRDTARLQIAVAALIAAAALGLLLALYLFMAALKLSRDPVSAVRNVERYQRLKVVGACCTALAYGWSLWEREQFWSAATRHGSGDWPAMVQASVLLACAMIPVWWVDRGAGMKGDPSKPATPTRV